MNATPTLAEVRDIVAAVKKRGLDGIAITEHGDRSYGFRVKEIVDRYFQNEVLIIPGQEVYSWPVEIVELYLPGDVTFRFLAHPGYPGDFTGCLDGVQGIEISNALHGWHIDKEKVREIAQQRNLFLLSNSDAHNIADIGRYHNVIGMDQLLMRAKDNTYDVNSMEKH